MRDLRASGRPVEIRGRICYSTCTMFLGLPQTCVSPDTVFGFHGPSRDGAPLAPDRFEYFSRVIARYYPKPLGAWYMSEGRKRLRGVFKIKGENIIRLGIRSCHETDGQKSNAEAAAPHLEGILHIFTRESAKNRLH